MVDPAGILPLSSSPILSWHICRTCHSSLSKGCLPALALANDLFLGEVPPELQGLTIVEEAMISRHRAKCTVIHLKED